MKVAKSTKKLISKLLAVAMILTNSLSYGFPVNAQTLDTGDTGQAVSSVTGGAISSVTGGAMDSVTGGAIGSVSGGAITYYVATTGNDTDGDGSPSNPFASLSKGVSQLKAGDTLVIREGSYPDQDFYLDGLKGTADAPYTIRGEGEVTFSRTQYNTSVWKNCTAAIQNCEYVNVSNIHFHYASEDSGTEAQTLIAFNDKNSIISNCTFTADQNGDYAPYAQVRVQGCDNVTFDANKVTGSGTSGFYLWGSISNVNFINNIITTYYGLYFAGDVVNCKVINNVFDNNGNAFLYGAYANCIVANNIFTGSVAGYGCSFDSTDICEYNAYTDAANAISASETNIFASAAELFADYSNGDYHLSDTSPCIGKGSSASYVPETDFNGHTRRTPSDIGAYNYGNVYYVADTGNDANSGLSDTEAFAGFTRAVAAIKSDPGSSLMIKGGTYSEQLNLDDIGSEDSIACTVMSYGGNAVLTGPQALTIRNSYNLDISGITLQEGIASAASAVLEGAYKCKLHDISVTGGGTGLRLSGNTSDCDIYNCNFSNTGGTDMNIEGSGNNRIFNNIFAGQHGIGNADNAFTDTVVTNNVFANAGDAIGSFHAETAGNIIQNNVFAAPVTVNASNSYDYNLYDSSLFADVPAGEGTNSLTGAPNFTDSSYHIGRLSDCRDKGTDHNAPAVDRDGKTRDGVTDIGAYEYLTRSEGFVISDKTPTGTDIPVDKNTTKIKIKFSEALNSSLNLGDYITVAKTKTGAPVAGTFAVQNVGAGTLVTFTANEDFSYSASYTVTVKQSITNTEDKMLYYTSDVTWNFTTEIQILDTYFIAMDGDDSNPGTVDSPKRTLNSFKSALKPGDTVIWREGTYDEYIVLSKEMPEGSEPVTFKVYDGERAVLTASSGSSVYATIYALGRNQNVRFEGLTFEPAGDQDYKGNALRFYNYGGSKIYVSNCTFYRCSPSISIIDELDQTCDAVEICNNRIIGDGASAGFYFQETRMKDGSYAKIYNNVIYNAKWSVELWGRSKNLLFYNNTFADKYDSAGGTGWYDIYPVAGAYVTNSDISENLVFKNNIFTKPIRTQLEAEKTLLDATQHCSFDNNVYASNSLTSYVTYNYGGSGPKLDFEELQSYQDRGLEQNGVYGRVSFVNTTSDARIIEADNAAIGAAALEIIDGVNAPAADINGNERLHNEAGAFAYDSTLAFVGNYSGSDADGSLSKPYASVQDAIEHGAGQIQVEEGTYDEEQIITGKVSVSAYSGAVVFSGPVSITGSDAGSASISDVTFDAAVTVTGKDVTVNNTVFTSNGSLSLNQAENAAVTNNIFEAADSTAVQLQDSTNCRLYNNVITQRNTAVKFTGAATANKIYNNTMYGNGSDIALSTGSTGNILKNNIISAAVANRSDNTFAYNLYNSDTISQSELEAFSEEHAVKASPAFINAKAKDFRIYKLSACAGAGIMDENTPVKDITGLTRSETPDIGAYAVKAIKYEYYVDASEGDDANAGTKDAPFKTIGAALAAIRAGETIHIAQGTYDENIILSDKPAMEADSYVIKAEGAVVLNGVISIDNSFGVTIDGITVHAGITNTAVSLNASPSAKLSSLSIRDAKVGISAVQSKDLAVGKTVIEYVEKGILLDGKNAAASVSISRTKVNHADVVALEAVNKVYLTLTGSVISNSAEGVLGNGEASFLIINNTFYNNTGYSINITQPDVVTTDTAELNIYNNVFSRAADGEGAFSCINKNRGFMSEYNLYDAGENDIITHFYGQDQTYAGTQANMDETCGRIGDPMFRNAVFGDFTLTKGSAGIRNGLKTISDTITAPEVDYNGVAYNAYRQDMGAFYSPYSCRTINVASGYTGGSGDGSKTAPYTTLQQALAVVDSGDTIIVHKGVYYGRIDINDLHGASDAPIQIIGCDDPDCVLCAPNASLQGPVFTSKTDYTDADEKAQEDVGIKLTNCSYINMEGLNYTGFIGAAIWTMDSDNLTVQDMNIWDVDNPDPSNSGTEGVLVNYTANSLFKDLRIWDIGQTRKSQADHGMYVGESTNVTFDSIKIENAPGAGIQFYAGDYYGIHSTDCTVKNCVFSDCCDGLIIVGVQDFTFTNNTFYNNWNADLYLDWTVDNNLFQNNIFYNDRSEPVDLGWGFAKPSVIGYQWNWIKNNEDGSTTGMITNNTFRNNLYEYKNFPAVCQDNEISSDAIPINDFMDRENAADTNNKFIAMSTGNVSFTGSLSNTDTEYEKAQKIFDNILQLNSDSACIDKGIAEKAPAADILGNTRDGLVDIGAYEYTGRSITLNQKAVSMDWATTFELHAQLNPISSNNITFKSSNTSVATVDRWGTITALQPGTANITASAGDVSAICAVTVTGDTSVKEIKLLKDRYATGDIITVFYKGATSKDWVGLLNAGADGSAYISFKYVEGTGAVTIGTGSASEEAAPGDYDIALFFNDGYTEFGRVSLSVRDAAGVSSVTISKDQLALTEGDTAQLSAAVNDDATCDKHIIWTSSDSSVVRVDQCGRILAAGAGTAEITASSYADPAVKASCAVTVEAAPTSTPTPEPTQPATPTPSPEPTQPATPIPTQGPTTPVTNPTTTPTPSPAAPTATPEPTQSAAPSQEPAAPSDAASVSTTTSVKTGKDGSVTTKSTTVVNNEDGSKSLIKTEIVEDKNSKPKSAAAAVAASPAVISDEKTVTFAYSMPEEQLKEAADKLAEGKTLKVSYNLLQSAILSQVKEGIDAYQINITQPEALRSNSSINISEIILPKEVLQAMADNKTKLKVTVQNEDNSPSYTWSFDGAQLKSSKAELKDINLGVDILNSKEDKTLQSIIKKDKNNSSGILADFNTKNLPGKTKLLLNVSDYGIAADAKTVYVYALDRKSNKLVKLSKEAYKLDKNGCISLEVANSQDYIILEKKPDSSVVADKSGK